MFIISYWSWANYGRLFQTLDSCYHTTMSKTIPILGLDQHNCLSFCSQEDSFSKNKRETAQQDDKIFLSILCYFECFLLPAFLQSVPVPCVHACIFSWHNWAIRVTLMHHIYLLFITGRICPDWPCIFLWQLFSQLLFRSILEFGVFSLSLFHLNKDTGGRDFFKVFGWVTQGKNGCKVICLLLA